MKKTISLFTIILSIYSMGQTVPAEYISPKRNSPGIYDFLRFGTSSNYSAGFMHNISSNTYGDGNDFSIFSYNNRDITIRTGTGNFIVFPSSGGNMGIGTTDPTEKLSVEKNGNTFIKLSNTSSNGSTMRIGPVSSNGYKETQIQFQERFGLFDSSTSQWRVNVKENGNVGIGTSSPSEKLHVVSSSSNEIAWPIVANNPYNNSTTNEYGVGIKLKHSSNNETWKWSGIASVNEGSWANNSGLALYSDGTEKVRIKHNGSVGIGTTKTSTHKLAVEGTIGAREIKVETTTWPDFVFYNNYKLPSLDEVEKFITQNNHLPEIPSEAEVLEDGINLGEMNAKLLQKIEELTLYLIEQNKRIITLEEKLAKSE